MTIAKLFDLLAYWNCAFSRRMLLRKCIQKPLLSNHNLVNFESESLFRCLEILLLNELKIN